jgi:hypothetical protein
MIDPLNARLENHIILELNHVDQLFNAPEINPFSTHEVDILGEAGIDRLQKHMMRHWPRWPGSTRLTLRLPPDQVTPTLGQQTRLALQRYCTEKIEDNRLQRRFSIEVSWRQFGLALLVVLFVIPVMYFLVKIPFDLLPAFLRGILAMLSGFAAAVAIFDAVYSLVFDWIPFVREDMVYRHIHSIEITIEPQGSPD